MVLLALYQTLLAPVLDLRKLHPFTPQYAFAAAQCFHPSDVPRQLLTDGVCNPDTHGSMQNWAASNISGKMHL